MSYTETISEDFFHFTKEEDEAIQKFLKERGYTYPTNTVCGSCCGMYSDEYLVNGVGGKWKSEQDRLDLHNLLKEMKCEHAIYGYSIDANPESGNAYVDRLSHKNT